MSASHEESIVRAFFDRAHRARHLELLSTPKGRRTFLESLYHFEGLDQRFARLVPKNEQTAEAIETRLKEKEAPATCYVISTDATLDGQIMPLNEAGLPRRNSEGLFFKHTQPSAFILQPSSFKTLVSSPNFPTY